MPKPRKKGRFSRGLRLYWHDGLDLPPQFPEIERQQEPSLVIESKLTV